MPTEKYWTTCRLILRTCWDLAPPADLSISAVRAALLPLYPPGEVPDAHLVGTALQNLLAEDLVTPLGRITDAGKSWFVRTFTGEDDGNFIRSG